MTIRLICALIACAGVANQTSAQVLDCALIARLDAQMASATGLPAGTPCAAVTQGGLVSGPARHSQAGAYFPLTGQIQLAADLDFGSPFGRSFLLHELVHAGQYRAGKDHLAPCPAALEFDAYQAQADYLLAQGLTREAVMTRTLAANLSACPGIDPMGY